MGVMKRDILPPNIAAPSSGDGASGVSGLPVPDTDGGPEPADNSRFMADYTSAGNESAYGMGIGGAVDTTFESHQGDGGTDDLDGDAPSQNPSKTIGGSTL